MNQEKTVKIAVQMSSCWFQWVDAYKAEETTVGQSGMPSPAAK